VFAVGIVAPRGTFDIMPDDAGLWQFVEGLVRETFEKCGYREIRTQSTPTSATDVWARG
jgi:histidyl-tRNA synthetase